jgi:DNA-binding XRE family transcriptional regulator
MTTASSTSPLQTIRETAGMSREGLADRAGVSVKTIERIEGGHTMPRRATKRVLALALGCRPEDISFTAPAKEAA